MKFERFLQAMLALATPLLILMYFDFSAPAYLLIASFIPYALFTATVYVTKFDGMNIYDHIMIAGTNIPLPVAAILLLTTTTNKNTSPDEIVVAFAFTIITMWGFGISALSYTYKRELDR